MDPTTDITVVNVISTSYSGSTWLNLLLGAHPDAFSVGELTLLDNLGRANCRFHGDDCPLWSRYDLSHRSNPFVQISRLSGKRVLVVNNSLEYLRFQGRDGVNAAFVHLVRDGRAVVASTLRKQPKATLWRTSRRWARATTRDRRVLARYADRPQARVLYERVAADPAGQLRRVCDTLGLPFDPDTLNRWRDAPHFLGGSLGLLKQLAEQRSDALHAKQHPDRRRNDSDFYQQQDLDRFLDERWKSELTDAQLRVFALAAGRQNRRYGYPRATDRTRRAPR